MKENHSAKKSVNPIIIAMVLVLLVIIFGLISLSLPKKNTETSINQENPTNKENETPSDDLIFKEQIKQLRRTERDTQRKNETMRVAAAINDYRASNRGRYPRDNDQFEQLKNKYIPKNDLGLDVTFSNDINSTPSISKIKIIANSQCDNNKVMYGNRFTILVGLESGGQYCLDN